MNHRAMPGGRALTGLGIVLIMLLGTWIYFSRKDEPLAGHSREITSSRAAKLKEDDVEKSVSGKSSDRGLKVEAKIRSILRSGPGEVGMVRIPAARWRRMLSARDTMSDSDSLVLRTVDAGKAGEELSEILLSGGNLNPRIEQSGHVIDWAADGVSFKGTVELREITSMIEMTVDDRSGDGDSVECVASVPAGAIVLVALPGSQSDALLLVLGSPAGN